MHQKTIDKLTGQNQLLIEASQEKEEKKVGFWDYYRDQSTAETMDIGIQNQLSDEWTKNDTKSCLGRRALSSFAHLSRFIYRNVWPSFLFRIFFHYICILAFVIQRLEHNLGLTSYLFLCVGAKIEGSILFRSPRTKYTDRQQQVK